MRSGTTHETLQRSQDAAQPKREREGMHPVTKSTSGQVSNQALNQALGAGKPLPAGVRAEMEARFGADFGDVRIHDQQSEQQLAQQQLAQAFTLGNHIAFNRGRYASGTSDGKHLLAHELAHVVQQRRGGSELPRAGGPLEQAAEHAATQVVSGSGPVPVAGASAVGIARQPLPEDEMQDLPAPPRTLSATLAKDEKNLSDAELDREMTLMEAWLVDLPTVPGRDFMVAEYKALYAERAARRARRTPPRPPRPQPEEGSMASLYGMVEDAPMQSVEVQEAHRAYLATGEMIQTRTPFSWIEIKKGKLMSRAQRYDAMLLKLGLRLAQVEDVVVDNRDPEYLTRQEYHDEFFARVKREQDECRDLWFKGRQNKCLRAVDDKYGGPAFKADRADREMRLRQQIMEVSDKIAAVRDSGAISLAGRVVGYGAGALTGHDALRWSEHGAAIGSMVGVAGSAYVGYTQRSQLQSYNAGGGLPVSRDADIHLVEPRSSRMTPTPPEPVSPQLTPSGSSKQPPTQPLFSSASTGSTGSVVADPATQAGLRPAPIPISSGKGLPQSDASKVLASNLAKQSPKKAGSITALPVRKRDTSPPSEPAQQKSPAVAAVEDKIAVGQTHGPGSTVATGAKPTTSVMGTGAKPTVASLKTPSKSSTTTGTGSAKRTTASTSKSTSTTGSAKSNVAPPRRPSEKTGANKTPTPVPVNASGGRGTNAERLVAVRVQGGGAAGKGTYFVEGTPEFEKAATDKRYTKMPESQAVSLKFRPAGTPFDQTIEPLKIGGVQVESNGAGTGKGNKHNISGRADIQSTQKANKKTFGKTVGASVAEAHGHKTLLEGGEVGVIRPGNVSTGGVDSITADVGRTAKPATSQGVPAGKPNKTTPKVFLNDFTGPKTTKGAKPTHANWVNELRDAVVHKRFGFNNKNYDDAVFDAIENGDVYVREVRIEATPKGTKVTPLTPRKVSVPASVKREVAKARQNRP